MKDRLILETRKIESFEARKQQEISRKYEREIQSAKRKIKANEDADGGSGGGDKPKFHRGRDDAEEGGRGDGRPDKKFKGGDGEKSRKRQVMVSLLLTTVCIFIDVQIIILFVMYILICVG